MLVVNQKRFMIHPISFTKQIKQTVYKLSSIGELLLLITFFMVIIVMMYASQKIAMGDITSDLILCIVLVILLSTIAGTGGYSLYRRADRINGLINSLYILSYERAENDTESVDILPDYGRQSLKLPSNGTDLFPLTDDNDAWKQLARDTTELACYVKYVNKFYITVVLIAYLVLFCFEPEQLLGILLMVFICLVLEEKYKTMIVALQRLDKAINNSGFFKTIESFIRTGIIYIRFFTMLLFFVSIELGIVLIQLEYEYSGKPLTASLPIGTVLLVTLWRFTVAIKEARVQRLHLGIKHRNNSSIPL